MKEIPENATDYGNESPICIACDALNCHSQSIARRGRTMRRCLRLVALTFGLCLGSRLRRLPGPISRCVMTAQMARFIQPLARSSTSMPAITAALGNSDLSLMRCFILSAMNDDGSLSLYHRTSLMLVSANQNG